MVISSPMVDLNVPSMVILNDYLYISSAKISTSRRSSANNFEVLQSEC